MKRGFLFAFIVVIIPAVGHAADSLDLDTIVVTKSRVHLLRPFSRTSQDLEDSSEYSFIDELRLTPVDLQSRNPIGGVKTDFTLRGTNYEGVSVLFNGARINDPQTGHHSDDIPLTGYDISRIDVLPGAASSLYGPNAIGGAIDFIPRRVWRNETVLESALGINREGRAIFSMSRKIRDWGLRFSTESSQSGGYRPDTDHRNFVANATSNLFFPSGSWESFLGFSKKEFGAYDFYTPASGFQSEEWTQTCLGQSSLNLEGDGFTLRQGLLSRRHYDKFLLDKTLQRSLYLNHHRTDVFMPDLYAKINEGLLQGLGAGLEYRREDITSTNLGRHSRYSTAQLLDYSRELTGRLCLGSSLRRDDYTVFNDAFSGSLSLKYALDEAQFVSFGVSRSIRVPTFTELYYTDPTTSGNARLTPEKAATWQAGYERREDSFSWGITLFFREEDDFIDWVKHSGADPKWQVENITSAQASGIEGYLRYKFSRVWKVDANYAYTDKRIDDRGLLYKYGPNYSRHLANVIFSAGLPWGQQAIDFTYKQRPGRRGWLLVGLYLSRDLNPGLKLFARATNLFNVEYQDIEGIPQPGRWMEIGFKLVF